MCLFVTRPITAWITDTKKRGKPLKTTKGVFSLSHKMNNTKQTP